MTIAQVEKALESRGIEFDMHLSGLSKSAYFTFTNKNGEDVKIRVSNHNLPASYSGRSYAVTRDFRFTDKMSDVTAFIQKETGKKAIRKTNSRVLTSGEIAILSEEANKMGVSIETVARFYFPGKSIVFPKQEA